MTAMVYAPVGACGLRVSRIGLGMMSYGDPAATSWALPEDQAEPIVRAAVELGITFFDTADMYSGGVSEEITGRLLARLFGRREDYVLATKVWPPAQVALAWLLGRPGVTAPVIGATRPQHLTDAVAALDLSLTGAQRARLEAPYLPHPDGTHA